jgi:hypothetical protein
MTLGIANQGVFAASRKIVAEVPVGEYSVIPADPVSTTGGSFAPGGATFNLDWGVKAITITDGGAGYSSAPAVSFSSGGAAATSSISGGVVTGATVTISGSGYSATPTVTFAAP